jgi:O-methyltransferase
MYEYICNGEGLERAIDYLEFGVYQGASIRWWVERNRDPQSRFVGFDTFEGLPEDWALTRMPKGTFGTAGTFPQIADPRCRFVKGLFQTTLQNFLRSYARGERLIVHLDADLYSSSLFVLTSLASLFRPGDLLIFDEFYGGVDEFRAFEDFCAAFPTPFTALAQARRYTQVAVRLD